MTDNAVATEAQLLDLLHQADDLEQRPNLPGSLEAYKATIDMQGMMALYARQKMQELHQERGQGTDQNSLGQQYWKDLAEGKKWAIQEPLAEYFSATSFNHNSQSQWSQMEVSGSAHLDTKSFFSGIRQQWMAMANVKGAIEQLVQDFLAMCDKIDLKDLSAANLPQAQQCISIGGVNERAVQASYQPKVNVLFVALELKATQMLGNNSEMVRAEIQISQSNLQASLNLDAIRRSKEHLNATRNRMIKLGLDDFERILAQ